MIFISLVLLGLLAYWLLNFGLSKRPQPSGPTFVLSKSQITILTKKVDFYNALSPEEKTSFEYRVAEFLATTELTPIETTIDEGDSTLIGASAIIPIFGFQNWKYSNIYEVIIYPNSFNEAFETKGKDRRIRGMVGTGFMNGKMILSRNALRSGFSNNSDRRNTAIHEFVHLMDKMDGDTDGIPELFLENSYVIPWLELIRLKTAEINEGKSEIDSYAATSPTEFFAVTSEYFFERPKTLARNHPKLYSILESIFQQDMDEFNLSRESNEIGRNDPCPCGSGKKHKHCCFQHE